MQKLLPDATHPRQTGNDPMIAPTKVLDSLVFFILVYKNRQLAHIVAPIPAVRVLQLKRPAKPTAPRLKPSPKAIFGFSPLTSGLCEVLSIFRSSQTQIYWLSAWVDIDNATEYIKSGIHETGVEQREYAPIVTIPLRTESLNLVSSNPCFKILLLARVENIVLLANFNIINNEYCEQNYNKFHAGQFKKGNKQRKQLQIWLDIKLQI